MTFPAALIPAALSAVRSFILLNRRVGEIRLAQNLDEPLPYLLPPVPQEDTPSPGDQDLMEDAFSNDASMRGVLEARDLLQLFDQYKNDPTMSQEKRDELGLRFIYLHREMTGRSIARADVIEGRGVDTFLVKSARLGRGSAGVQVLRATAEILVDYLGDNAAIFLAKSPNQQLISTVLREFAVETDLEEDSGRRILGALIGAVAVAGSDPESPISDKPLAVLLFSSLGRVRQEKGDDFVSSIVSLEGFSAVVSDWMTHVATDPFLVDLVADIKGLDENSGYNPEDPSTLPANLQPIYGALSETLKAIGGQIGATGPLRSEEVFRDVFGAVLTGLSENSAALLREELGDQRIVAHVLNATIKTLDTVGIARPEGLIAPIFDVTLNALAQVLPDLGADDALSKAELIIEDLAKSVASPRFQAALGDVTHKRGKTFTKLLVRDLFAVIGQRADVLASGTSGPMGVVLEETLRLAPELLDRGLTREMVARIFENVVETIYPEDTAEGHFARDLLPIASTMIKDGTRAGLRLTPQDVEHVLMSYIRNFKANAPIWQNIYDSGLIGSFVDALSEGFDGVPRIDQLPGSLIARLMQAALDAAGRYAVILQDLVIADPDPKTALKDVLRQVTERALRQSLDKLGRGIDAAQAPQLTELAMEFLLDAVDGTLPTDAELIDFLDRNIALLRGGEPT